MATTPIEINGVDNVQLITNVAPVASIAGAVLTVDFRVTVAQSLASNPGSPVVGQVWLNTVTQRFMAYDGAVRTLAYNPMTDVGDIVYGAAGGAETRLSGNTTTGLRFLASVGTGIAATAPAWTALPLFGTAQDGIVPASGGGTTNFLRADGSWAAPPGGGGSGTVTSVALALPGELTVTGSPVTTAGTLTAVWATESANSVFAGPTTGVAATPAFRALVAADIPNAMTTLGDILYGGVAGVQTRLAGSTSATAVFLSQTGTGVVSAAPSWVGSTGTGSVVLDTAPTVAGPFFTGVATAQSIRVTSGAVAATVYGVRINQQTAGSSINYNVWSGPDVSTLNSDLLLYIDGSTGGPQGNSHVFVNEANLGTAVFGISQSNGGVGLYGIAATTGTADVWGFGADGISLSSGTVSTVAGGWGEAGNQGTGTVTTLVGFQALTNWNTGGGSVTKCIGIQIANQTVGASRYGLEVLQASGANNYAILTSGTAKSKFGGAVEITGGITISSGSGGVFTYSDGTSQSTAAVPTSRQIINGTGITGGGDLSADRTLSVVANTTNQKVIVDNNSSTVGTRKEINFIPGTNVTMSILDNSGSDRVDVTIAATGSGPVGGVPSTLKDLVMWYQGDKQPLVTNGKAVTVIADQTPNQTIRNGLAVSSTAGATALSPALNSLNGWTLPGTSSGRYQLPTGAGVLLTTATIFVVYKIASYVATTGGDFIAGGSNCLEFRIDPTGHLQLTQSGTANIGTGTGVSSLATWYQANATYDSSTGAFAFRRASTADGSGTNVKSITGASFALFYNSVGSNGDFNGAVAEMIVYNRVLSGAEITSVETYLLGKWGV